MKKHLFAGLLAATVFSPAFAAQSKFVVATPDEPLHRRAVIAAVVMTLIIARLCARRASKLPEHG